MPTARLMHGPQNRWPQGVVMTLLSGSKQMGHETDDSIVEGPTYTRRRLPTKQRVTSCHTSESEGDVG